MPSARCIDSTGFKYRCLTDAIFPSEQCYAAQSGNRKIVYPSESFYRQASKMQLVALWSLGHGAILQLVPNYSVPTNSTLVVLITVCILNHLLHPSIVTVLISLQFTRLGKDGLCTREPSSLFFSPCRTRSRGSRDEAFRYIPLQGHFGRSLRRSARRSRCSIIWAPGDWSPCRRGHREFLEANETKQIAQPPGNLPSCCMSGSGPALWAFPGHSGSRPYE